MESRRNAEAIAGRFVDLVTIVDAFDRAITQAMASVTPNGQITRGQWRALMLLSDGEGHTMREVAQRTGVPRATATRLIDGLVAQALAYRRSDSLDRRRVLVFATDEALLVVERAVNELEGTVAEAMEALDDDERELLMALLNRIEHMAPSASLRSLSG